MTDHLDRNLRALLGPVGPGPSLPDDRRTEVLGRLLDAGRARRPRPRFGRIGIAAVVLLGLYLGIRLPMSDTPAFASVLDNLQKRGYAFTYWDSRADGRLSKAGRAMVLQPGLVRWDMPDLWGGVALVVDAIRHETRWVSPAGRDLGRIQVPKEFEADPNRFQAMAEANPLLGPIETLWDLTDGEQTPLGTATLDGVEVRGYRVERDLTVLDRDIRLVYRIWADVATGLPRELRIDFVDPEGVHETTGTVFKDFDFNAHIDESLFGLGPNDSQSDPDDPRFVITPRQGMGPARFGMALEEVTRLIGQPDLHMANGYLQYEGFALTTRDGRTLGTIACGDINSANSQVVRRCPCRTSLGIRMGSSERAVIAAYGEPDRRDPDRIVPDAGILRYSALGMEFRLKDDKVYFMYFGAPIDPSRR